MIFKPIPPLSGLTNLVIGCTIAGVVETLLLVPISIDTNLVVCTSNQGKQFGRLIIQVDNFVHQSEPTPYYLESTPL